MKKIILFLTLATGITFASCGDNYSRNAEQLPDKAKELISQNFKSAISLIKVDKEVFGHEYEVILADGCEITFTDKGDWKEIETPNNKAVPTQLVPKPITEYVSKHHSGATIVGIEKKKKGYEVELSNNIDLKFDTKGIFLKYDD